MSYFKKSCAFWLTIIISSLFCLSCYHFDNKYTYPGTQPANGLLAISEEDIKEDPLRFLCRGWAFYPDTLLTPKDFTSGSPSNYMIYTFIGEHTRFDGIGNRNTSHGSGTYVMNLNLPKKLNTYSLEIPEIFSAYKLYINNHLVFQMGNPDPKHYQARTQTQIVSFEASESTTIILAVSDYSHFYSGMVYPPSFGIPSAISLSRDIRLGICLFADTIGIIAALLSLYFGIRMKHKNAILFSVLCFAMCIFTSYPLVHSIASMPVFPLYALELASGQLVTLLVLILHNGICNVMPLYRFISCITAGLFTFLSLLYGLFSAFLTVPIMNIFYVLLFLFKACTALYLLFTAYMSLQARDDDVRPLFYAAVVYAAAFLWDRILPVYEPIHGGWFLEWGSLLLVLSIGYTLWRDVVSAYAYNLTFSEEHRQVTRQLSMQTEYTRQLTEQSEENRRLNHDFRQHLRTIIGIAKEHNDNDIIEYLQQMTKTIQPTIPGNSLFFCQNAAVDALLRYYYGSAKEKGIDITIKLSIPDTLPLSDVETCTIIGNLLENSVEACEREIKNFTLSSSKKVPSILLRTEDNSQTFFLLMENTYDGKVRRKDSQFLSRKSNELRVGIGLESVRKTLRKYSGTLDIYPMKELFRIGISIPLNKAAEEVITL